MHTTPEPIKEESPIGQDIMVPVLIEDIHHHDHDHDHKENRFAYGKFVIAIGLQLAAIYFLFKQFLPVQFAAETANIPLLLAWTAALGIPLSLFEYLYHRYLLHSAVLPFLASMHRAHSTHHGLTNVKAPVTPKEPEKLVVVDSEYPVEEEHQEESMMFPLWSFVIFHAVFMGILGLPLKAIFPSQPIALATVLCVTLYYCSYEIWHAILHLPYDRFWKPLTEGKFMQPLFKRIYSFHVMHHWRPTSNLAVVGFWGIALWDYAFRTHVRPIRLPVDGAKVNYRDAHMNKPMWPISAIDKMQGRMYKGSRNLENTLARIFLKRKTN